MECIICGVSPVDNPVLCVNGKHAMCYNHHISGFVSLTLCRHCHSPSPLSMENGDTPNVIRAGAAPSVDNEVIDDADVVADDNAGADRHVRQRLDFSGERERASWLPEAVAAYERGKEELRHEKNVAIQTLEEARRSANAATDHMIELLRREGPSCNADDIARAVDQRLMQREHELCISHERDLAIANERCRVSEEAIYQARQKLERKKRKYSEALASANEKYHQTNTALALSETRCHELLLKSASDQVQIGRLSVYETDCITTVLVYEGRRKVVAVSAVIPITAENFRQLVQYHFGIRAPDGEVKATYTVQGRSGSTIIDGTKSLQTLLSTGAHSTVEEIRVEINPREGTFKNLYGLIQRKN